MPANNATRLLSWFRVLLADAVIMNYETRIGQMFQDYGPNKDILFSKDYGGSSIINAGTMFWALFSQAVRIQLCRCACCLLCFMVPSNFHARTEASAQLVRTVTHAPAVWRHQCCYPLRHLSWPFIPGLVCCCTVRSSSLCGVNYTLSAMPCLFPTNVSTGTRMCNMVHHPSPTPQSHPVSPRYPLQGAC